MILMSSQIPLLGYHETSHKPSKEQIYDGQTIGFFLPRANLIILPWKKIIITPIIKPMFSWEEHIYNFTVSIYMNLQLQFLGAVQNTLSF
jgi:hypothetical protein